jgi:hypothetical protein
MPHHPYGTLRDMLSVHAMSADYCGALEPQLLEVLHDRQSLPCQGTDSVRARIGQQPQTGAGVQHVQR